MEGSASAHSIPPQAPLSERKDNATAISPKIAELTESRNELLSRIQNLKQDLQNWRLKMDNQVKVYHDELSELKKSLYTEVEQLRTEFQNMRNTLQQHQEDVTSNLKKLELQDVIEEKLEAEGSKGMDEKVAAQDSP